MKAKHTHLLLGDGGLSMIDCWASCLYLACRGAEVLAGDASRAERDKLAALLDGGALAELLASGRPIRVDSTAAAWVFEEL